ncbi:MAG: hypothetical protein Q7S50_04610 [bacterium]|nr:hypothetical protein [bacterium]
MKHYICTGGCEGVSEKPGDCQALACPKYGKPLSECNCENGKHEEVKKGQLPREEREVE